MALGSPEQTKEPITIPGTGAGWDSILYRVYIVGGILVIAAVAVVVGFLDPAGQGPLWIPLILWAHYPVDGWYPGLLVREAALRGLWPARALG